MTQTRINIFCTACKRWIKGTTEREFRESGHYQDGLTHLLPPDIGRSTRRHEAAMKRDVHRQIIRAEHAARTAALTKVNKELMS